MGALVGRVALAYLLASGAALSADSLAAERLCEELHYVTTYHGRVIGIRRVRVYEAMFKDRPCRRTEVRERTRLSTRGVTVGTLTERVEITDAEGYGIELTERRKESGQVIDTRVEVTDGAVVFHMRVAGRARAFRAERRGPVRFDLDGRALARKGLLAVGRKLRCFVVARVELGIAELEAEVLGKAPLPEIPGTYEAGSTGFRIRVSNVSGAGEPWELVADDEGRTVELRVGPMVVRRASRAEARLPRRAVLLRNRFPTEERLTRLEGVRSMRVEAAVADGVRDDVFPNSFYGDTSVPRRAASPEGPDATRGGKYVLSHGDARRKYYLRLKEARPDGRLPREELSEEDRRRFLVPSPLVESDAREIESVALKVVGGEKEPLKKTLLLTRWVYRSLAKRSGGPATASALEALRARSGDCTEHAALLAALLRASGLPARQVMGLVHDGTGFQFHAWAEAYARDRWVPIDPTLGRVGVPALYILLGREGDLIEYHSRANALQGRTSMRIVEVH